MQIIFCAETEKMILCHSGKNRHKKDSKKRNKSQYFFGLRKPFAVIPRFESFNRFGRAVHKLWGAGRLI